MKKIMCAVLALMIIVSIVINVGASMEVFTASDAEELFFEGYKLYHVYQDRYCIQMYNDVYQDETVYYANFEGDSNIQVYPTIIGVQYGFEQITGYFDGNKLYPIDSTDDLKEIADRIFNESLISEIMTDGMYDEPQPLFYQDGDGNIYHNHRGSINFPAFAIVGYTDFKVDGNKASIVVDLKYETLSMTYFVKETVEFVKTDAGWRIANNIFSDSLYNKFLWKENVYKLQYHWDEEKGSWTETYIEYYVSDSEDLPEHIRDYLDFDNPDTSDQTASIIILTTISLVSLAAAFAMKKRRAK